MGRKEELLNVGGFKVAPAEIEEVLLRFDGILDAAVIKSQAPEEGFSEGTKALIVVDKKSKFKNTDLLKTYCLKELEAYKVPNEFEIVDKLPRSVGAGKKRPR
jgi:long-chain acyl-CoA synthetase